MLAADEMLDIQDGSPVAIRTFLTHVTEAGQVSDLADDLQFFWFLVFFEPVLELRVVIKVVLDRAFIATCDKNDVGNSRCDKLLDNILNHGLVHYGQHLFGKRFGDWQKPCSISGYGHNRFRDFHYFLPKLMEKVPSVYHNCSGNSTFSWLYTSFFVRYSKASAM
ncbi:MAG: hypothetical protein UY65_C0021G0004 [Parcubacteria group bacterium GW2011_GWA2_51_12]|nr:MAG: hypothetical protein UY65_C0021G0004 [Parcubacteria group bacterium GW2011_GWA2_51_12]